MHNQGVETSGATGCLQQALFTRRKLPINGVVQDDWLKHVYGGAPTTRQYLLCSALNDYWQEALVRMALSV